MNAAPVVPVTSAAQAAAADAAAIAAGTPSRALMQRAGAAAAAEIATRLQDAATGGVLVVTGPGNNGGDGWVIARALHAVGVAVRVVEAVAARTPDAVAERALAIADGVAHSRDTERITGCSERIVVDAVLGTGLTADAPLRDGVAHAVAAMHARARGGATIVAIDVPTGLDATDGLHVGAPPCALTLTFGTMKRGALVARDRCGEIVLLDIGLGGHASSVTTMRLATGEWFVRTLPPIHAASHKGTRGKVAVVGGAAGMSGAVTLAARAALRSGAGMVKCVVAPDSLLALQQEEPAVLTAAWPADDAAFAREVGEWADVILLGPGLGRDGARGMVERALRAFTGPVVLDADALNAYAGESDTLAALLEGRDALLTPHPLEFARLVGRKVDDVLVDRFEETSALAATLGATVLFKGVPTIVSDRSGDSIVVAEGTPILATGGSGDVLGGIAAALTAQTRSAFLGGALAAFAHGRAASVVSARQVRGHTLDDVLHALPGVWSLRPPPPRAPILAELPAVGEGT